MDEALSVSSIAGRCALGADQITWHGHLSSEFAAAGNRLCRIINLPYILQ
ncbi:hypothetical protein SPHINGOT1_280032 [Sphingomonas sp. T1]|nr:hypothetical protein SPHINGOT1_280032 [Sphingomonas sp. T1]